MTETFRIVLEKWYYSIYLNNCYALQKYEKLTDEMSLNELEVDSLEKIDFLADLEVAYNIHITYFDSKKFKFDTMKFRDMCNWVERKSTILRKPNNKMIFNI